MSRHRKHPLTVIIEMYGEGLSNREIGRRLGVHRSTVDYALKTAGMQPNMPIMTRSCRRLLRRQVEGALIRERSAKIVAMYRQGIPVWRISELLPISRTQAYQALRTANAVPPRPVAIKIEPARFRRREPTEIVERLLQLAIRKRRAA